MKTLAIYPGSFNPFHVGHLNIVEKAERVFGKGNVVIAIGVNPAKVDSGENLNEKVLNLSNKIGRPVLFYKTFLHELIEEKESEGYNVVLVRGLRNGNDLEYEDNQLKFINDFKKDTTNVVFFRCDEKYSHVSSSAIRSLESFRKGSSKEYLV
jgi:pantetheine-phosphate adenylyltransferase